MTEADEADLLGDEPTGVELTQDEIDTLLNEPTGHESSDRVEPSNLSETSTADIPEETSTNNSVNGVYNNESANDLLDNGEASENRQETDNQIEENGNDTLEYNEHDDDDLTKCGDENSEITDSTVSALPTESVEQLPTQNVEEGDQHAQNGAVPFSMDDLLNLDGDNDNIHDDDEVCLLDSPKNDNGVNLKRTTSCEDDDISVPTLDMNPSKKSRPNDDEEVQDDDVLVEELPLPLPNQPGPRFNRIGQQMIRCVIEKFRKENPEVLLSTYMENEVKKCQSGLRGMGKKLKEMSAICTNQMEELNKRWQYENQKLKDQIEKVTILNKQLSRMQAQKSEQSRIPTPQRYFSTPNPQVYSAERRREPVNELRTPTNHHINGVEPVRSPSVRTPKGDGPLPDRINIDISLVSEPRLCYVDRPFDSLPLRNYPASMQKILKRGIMNVQVVINTAYEDFIGTKKLHGQVRYAIPKDVHIEEGSLVRLYFWIESIHSQWTMSNSAKVFPSGITKFSMTFNPHQALFQGDRISFLAFLYINATTKFVSGQVTYNLRRPVVKEQIGME